MSSNIISKGNEGFYKRITQESFRDGFLWKVGLTYIPSRKNKFKFSLPAGKS